MGKSATSDEVEENSIDNREEGMEYPVEKTTEPK